MSDDVFIGMLHVFSTSLYALLDPGFTLSFVTPLLALTFETLPEVLHDPIIVRNSLRENVRADRVHKDCPIVLCGNNMSEDLLELPMSDFNIILGMDWLHKCYDFINCCNRVVIFVSLMKSRWSERGSI